MRINKTIKGEVFPFHVKIIPFTMTAEVKFLISDNATIGTIDKDFNYINLPDNFLSPYISGIGRVKVGKLKINKEQKIDIIELNMPNN